MGFRKLVPNPGRHDGTATGNGYEGKSICERPSIGVCIRHDGINLAITRLSAEQVPNNLMRSFGPGPVVAPHICKERIKAGMFRTHCREKVIGLDSFWTGFPELPKLIGKNVKDQLGIKFGIADVITTQTPIFIMFHEFVIWIPGMRERIQPESVDNRLGEESRVCHAGPQVASIEIDEVVSKQEFCRIAITGQCLKGIIESTALEHKRLSGILSDSCKALDATCRRIDFEVD